MKNFLKILTLGFAFSSAFVFPVAQAQAAPYFSTTAQATVKASSLGYSKTNEYSSGQAVYKANKPISSVIKGLIYITPDVDSHNGGAWKAGKSVAALGSKATRLGTYNADLTVRIGD